MLEAQLHQQLCKQDRVYRDRQAEERELGYKDRLLVLVDRDFLGKGFLEDHQEEEDHLAFHLRASHRLVDHLVSRELAN